MVLLPNSIYKGVATKERVIPLRHIHASTDPRLAIFVETPMGSFTWPCNVQEIWAFSVGIRNVKNLNDTRIMGKILKTLRDEKFAMT